MLLLTTLSRHTSTDLSEVGFLFILIAGVWLVVSEIPAYLAGVEKARVDRGLDLPGRRRYPAHRRLALGQARAGGGGYRAITVAGQSARPVFASLIMGPGVCRHQPRTHLADLFGDRPGWRLEPRTTPGASPLWCYVDAGQIELSVTAERDGVHLFVMDDDRELLFGDA